MAVLSMISGPNKAGLPALYWDASPNFSSRIVREVPNLIVIHDTEGGYAGTRNWFEMFKSHVSAHIVLSEDGTQATQMVPFGKKAWHACYFNGKSIGIEMAGFESKGFSEAEWQATANIVAYLCVRFNIPVQASKGSAGIARHYDLGKLGGGHTDPCTDVNKFTWFLGLVAKAVALNKAEWASLTWGKM